MFDKGVNESPDDWRTCSGSRQSLLKKFDIPIEFLDYSHVEKCTDVREIEKILKVLRSGEEGYYPDLISFVERRLGELDPSSRTLRVELPIIKSQSEPQLREEINTDLEKWLASMESENGSGDMVKTKEIFPKEEIKSGNNFPQGVGEVPIRGQESQSEDSQGQESVPVVMKKDETSKPVNADRIKAWEYDKWEKFDVDEELMKFDIADEKISQWECHHKGKLQEEMNRETHTLMRNMDKNKSNVNEAGAYKRVGTDGGDSPRLGVDKPSFIEEIPVSVPSVSVGGGVGGDKTSTSTSKSAPPAPKIIEIEQPSMSSTSQTRQRRPRRIRIQIDDVHVGF